MEKRFDHPMTKQEKQELIEFVNTFVKGDVVGTQASLFQTLGKGVHEGVITKDDLWDIFVGTYHTDEEYTEMMENPDTFAMLSALFM